MLEKVKKLLGITGTFQNDTIQEYIDEVKQYMLDGGVDASIVNATSSAGVIARGVADLWNYGSGQGRFSNYFMQRVVQLSYKEARTLPTSSYIATSNLHFVTTAETDTFRFSGDYDVLVVHVNGFFASSDMYQVVSDAIVFDEPLSANQTVDITTYKLATRSDA